MDSRRADSIVDVVWIAPSSMPCGPGAYQIINPGPWQPVSATLAAAESEGAGATSASRRRRASRAFAEPHGPNSDGPVMDGFEFAVEMRQRLSGNVVGLIQ